MIEDELVEKMAQAYGEENPFMTRSDHCDALRAVLAIARPIIEREALEKARAVLSDAEATLVFIKTALPVLQCMTGKIGLDLGEAKSLEMQKAADETIAAIRALIPEQSK